MRSGRVMKALCTSNISAFQSTAVFLCMLASCVHAARSFLQWESACSSSVLQALIASELGVHSGQFDIRHFVGPNATAGSVPGDIAGDKACWVICCSAALPSLLAVFAMDRRLKRLDTDVGSAGSKFCSRHTSKSTVSKSIYQIGRNTNQRPCMDAASRGAH